MAYNPFQKRLGETLQPEDFQTLITQQVSEGYYIEYKREMPNKTKIARSLASLANTYGGWYIVGMETNEHNVATAVPGFNCTSCHDPISVVRDLAKHYIDPVPIFFPQAVILNTENLVLAIYVPDNQETPFITKDGRIYRRTYDSSDPIPEASRYALDQLVERGREVSQQFARFSQDERSFSEAEDDGWLKIYISPYPLGSIQRPTLLSTSVISDLLEVSKKPIQFSFFNSKSNISGNIKFNAAYPTSNSVIFRQTSIQNEAFNSLTIELDNVGRARIFIPLQRVKFQEHRFSDIRSSTVRQQIMNRLKENGERKETYLNFFDIGKTWLIIVLLVHYYLDWLGIQTFLTGFQVAVELDDVWRYVPFYDCDSWGKQVEQFGLPVLMRSRIHIPPKEGSGYIVNIDSDLCFDLCVNTGLACGLPPEFFIDSLGQILEDAMT